MIPITLMVFQSRVPVIQEMYRHAAAVDPQAVRKVLIPQHCAKTLNSRARNDGIVEPDPALLSMAVSETQPSCEPMEPAARRA